MIKSALRATTTWIKQRLQHHGDFILLFFITSGMHYPMLVLDVWQDTGDTIFSLEIFYAFYNNFFFHGELPRWLPYGSFGIQSDYWQLISLTPAAYFTGALGALFRIENVFLLYKLSVLLEQWMLLWGSYLLCRRLFHYQSAAFLTCLGIIASTIWAVQISWNFHLFYLLPLIFYLLICFFDKQRPHYLWWAGTTFVMAQLGCPAYYVTFHFLILLLFFGLLTIKRIGALKCLMEKSKKNLFFLLGMLVLACLYLYFAGHMFDYITSVGDHTRDAATHQVSLEGFLQKSPGLQGHEARKFLGLLFPNFTYETLTCTIYIGFLPLVFLIYAFAHVRGKIFMAFGILTLYLILFSLGKGFFIAKITYYLFPPIKYFRGTGIILGLIRIFLLILAGFGLDGFLQDVNQGSAKIFWARPQSWLFFGAGILVILFTYFIVEIRQGNFFLNQHADFYVFFFGLTLIAVLLLAGEQKSTKTLGTVAILFFLLDIVSYQNLFFTSKYEKWPEVPPNVSHVADFRFQPARLTGENTASRVQAVSQLITGGLDKEAYNFMLFDKCIPLKYMNWHWAQSVFEIMLPQFQPKVMSLVGCGTSKIRLIWDILVARDKNHAKKLLFTRPPNDREIILYGVPDSLATQSSASSSLGTVSVTRFSFNRLDLKADVRHPQGAWVYYADAFHPSWCVHVDGKRGQIFPANIAFKAVFLPHGHHTVRFSFFDGFQGFLSIMLAILGILFSLIILSALFKNLLTVPNK